MGEEGKGDKRPTLKGLVGIEGLVLLLKVIPFLQVVLLALGQISRYHQNNTKGQLGKGWNSTFRITTCNQQQI